MSRIICPTVSFKFVAGSAALLAAALLSGCANMVSTASPVAASAAEATMTGQIHGGNQPVSNADIRLYAAGLTGYGSAPTLYATTTTANDGFGSFNFTQRAGIGTSANGTPVYGCPTDGTDPQMYLSAHGGNTQGSGNGTNTAASFVLAIGKCSTISTGYFSLNELTTVATVAALQQYFSPSDSNADNVPHFGLPNTTQAVQAYANGVATISNLVNVSTGVSAAHTVTSTPAGSSQAVTVTITPEIAKINTIADIVSSCINTTSSSSPTCQILFANAVPPNSGITSQPAKNFGNATSSTSAVWNMLTDPTSGGTTAMQNLYGLIGPQAPYQPIESSAPTDWTIGIRYSSTSSCGAGAPFLAASDRLIVDATGNIFAASAAIGGNVSAISSTGSPTVCGFSGAGAIGGITFGTQGNLWVTNTASGNVIRYDPASAVSTTLTTPTTGNGVIHGDGAGNILFAPAAATSTSLYSFPQGAAADNPTATLISNSVGSFSNFFAIDTSNRVFVANTAATSNALYNVYPSTASTATNGYQTTNVGSANATSYVSGVAAGLAGTIVAVNGNSGSAIGNTVTIFNPTSTPGYVQFGSTSAQYSGGLNAPMGSAIDGAGNIWIASTLPASGNYVSGAKTSGLFLVNEFSATGYAISPTGNGTAAVNGGFQKEASVLPTAPRGVAIDPTGNVWFGSASAAGTSLLELVGAAVPVVTPIATSMATGVTTSNAVRKP